MLQLIDQSFWKAWLLIGVLLRTGKTLRLLVARWAKHSCQWTALEKCQKNHTLLTKWKHKRRLKSTNKLLHRWQNLGSLKTKQLILMAHLQQEELPCFSILKMSLSVVCVQTIHSQCSRSSYVCRELHGPGTQTFLKENLYKLLERTFNVSSKAKSNTALFHQFSNKIYTLMFSKTYPRVKSQMTLVSSRKFLTNTHYSLKHRTIFWVLSSMLVTVSTFLITGGSNPTPLRMFAYWTLSTSNTPNLLTSSSKLSITVSSRKTDYDIFTLKSI